MGFVVMLLAACALVALCGSSIKRRPGLWYALAAALVVLHACAGMLGMPAAAVRVLSVVVQRGTLATALFVVVMYSSVFPQQSAVRRSIAPIRAELSIIACILALGHCLNYARSYVGVLLRNAGVLGVNQLASLACAFVLFALLLLLGATSLKAVKQRMGADAWKRIQRCSYAFFILIYVHELLVLYPSALKGSGDAYVTCVAGGVVFVAYVVLRIMRFVRDRGEGDALRRADGGRKADPAQA